MWKFHIYLFTILLVVGAIELLIELSVRRKLRLYQEGKIKKWELSSTMIDQDGNIKHYPAAMSWMQLSLTGLSYVGTIAALVALLNALQHVPGADLAKNFFE